MSDSLGLPTRIAASFFGLMLTVLTLTGPMIGWNKRRAPAKGRRAARLTAELLAQEVPS